MPGSSDATVTVSLDSTLGEELFFAITSIISELVTRFHNNIDYHITQHYTSQDFIIILITTLHNITHHKIS